MPSLLFKGMYKNNLSVMIYYCYGTYHVKNNSHVRLPVHMLLTVMARNLKRDIKYIANR